MPTAAVFLRSPDPLTREVARAYAGGAFLMDNGDGLQFYTTPRRALVPLSAGAGLHVPRRLQRDLKHFELRVNTAFPEVLAGCRGELPGSPPRDGQWISGELAAIYLHLRAAGLAHSFEAWRGGELAGGVLGLALGGAFLAESKFHRQTNGSKAALIGLAGRLHTRGFALLDAQIQSPHLATLGVREVGSRAYHAQLKAALELDVALEGEDAPAS
ncbi:leucyl/phenylalanyl-tRNA--protein transferase [Deinococcus arcticus]|uniref:Leucyl/phenylalanyl-tRNA--protein transferase n=1 Tax=Deinococcus arcticus TaxID=2136176 RepID=A0A2T3WC96_9DEIO|nr:leucyl/phenylalanyl-tRNA--protein transferase [Deinococcus arcticus]PTA69518.1 leucyl/phenylalanyl-tRNA--protein transferase [Deinococcus arcticus]